jgi:hypothetical protein
MATDAAGILDSTTSADSEASVGADTQVEAVAIADGGAEAMSSSDADTTVDATVDATGDLPEPCPSSMTYDSGPAYLIVCDQTCFDASVAGICRAATCSSGPTLLPQYFPQIGEPILLRTPDRPGTDPSCAALCDGGASYAYVMSFTFNYPAATGYFPVRIAVEAPWEIVGWGIVGRACQPASGPFECVSASLPYNSSFAIGTRDPNARARNVIISTDHSSQSCPVASDM